MLLGNLLAIARDFELDSEIPIQLQITRMKEEKWLGYKGRKVLCFTLNFKTNLSLPDYVGLGKGVSVGFGSVKRVGGVEPRETSQTNDAVEVAFAEETKKS